VIVHNLDINRIAGFPPKTDSPLIIDPNAVLPCPISLQRFKSISWRGNQVSQFRGCIQLPEFALRYPLERPEAQYSFPPVKTSRVRTAEGFDHTAIVYRAALNARRFIRSGNYIFSGVLSRPTPL
jgi:hypothetical protein